MVVGAAWAAGSDVMGVFMMAVFWFVLCFPCPRSPDPGASSFHSVSESVIRNWQPLPVVVVVVVGCRCFLSSPTLCGFVQHVFSVYILNTIAYCCFQAWVCASPSLRFRVCSVHGILGPVVVLAKSWCRWGLGLLVLFLLTKFQSPSALLEATVSVSSCAICKFVRPWDGSTVHDVVMGGDDGRLRSSTVLCTRLQFVQNVYVFRSINFVWYGFCLCFFCLTLHCFHWCRLL
jgi:hypothetical protein